MIACFSLVLPSMLHLCSSLLQEVGLLIPLDREHPPLDLQLFQLLETLLLHFFLVEYLLL